LIKKFFLLQLCLVCAILMTGTVFSDAPVRDKRLKAKYPDLTKSEPWKKPKKKGHYNLGPTGLVGWMVGGDDGFQIEVSIVFPDSPASGLIKQGDVIIGLNGKKFNQGGSLLEVLGAAINEAEKDENKGKLSFMIWRNLNWDLRNRTVDMKNIDVNDLFIKMSDDQDSQLHDWMNKEQKEESTKKMIYGEVKGVFKTIKLTIPVLGTFSESTPYNCPKSEKIIERGLALIRKQCSKKNRISGRYWMQGHALLASGTPEDLALVKKLVHNSHWFKPDRKISEWGFHYGSWHSGYQLVFGSEYYMKTGDKYILPALTEIAIKTSGGQTYGGSWSHSFSARSFNFGKINGRATGYGAMNQAGGPCFLGLVMARKAGIKDIAVDAAIARSIRFYSGFSENGAAGYGMGSAVGYADSNGKNGPPAFAFKLLGRKTDAQYFAWCQSVASWWKHGGHCGGSWGAMWRTFGAGLGGPLSVKAYHKKHRNYYAVGRRYDGGWVWHDGTGGPGFEGNGNALNVLRYIVTRQKTYLTGKDPMPETQLTEERFEDVVDGQAPNNAMGKFVAQFSNEQLLTKFRTFYPKMREIYAKELGKRYQEGKAPDLISKLLVLLRHKDPRKRAAGVITLAECGEAIVRKHLATMLTLFDDNREFVRLNAVRAIAKHYSALEKKAIEPLMELLTRKQYWEILNDSNNVPRTAINILFGENSIFKEKTYDLGVDAQVTRDTLERSLSLDSGRHEVLKAIKPWSKKQVLDMAGPITYGAEYMQYNDMMEAGAPLIYGKQILKQHGLNRELAESCVYDLHALEQLPRSFYLRARGKANIPFISKPLLELKGQARHTLPQLKRFLTRAPNTPKPDKKFPDPIRLYRIIRDIERDSSSPVPYSAHQEVQKLFKAKVATLKGKDAIATYSRSLLKPTRKTYFRQLAAMDELVKQLDSEALVDLLPYVYHEQWRWRNHSRSLIKKMTSKVNAELIKQFNKSTDTETKAGIMACMTLRTDKQFSEIALHALKNERNRVKAEAIQTLVASTGLKHLKIIIESMRGLKSEIVLGGYEQALLSCKGNSQQEQLISKALISIIRKSRSTARASIYYVLAMLGGKSNLAILNKVSSTKSESDFKNVVSAVSFSRDPLATEWIIDIIKSNSATKRAHSATDIGLRRMVISEKGVGSKSEEAAFNFAKEVLKVVRSPAIFRMLGSIDTPRCSELLFEYMKKGPEEITEVTAQNLLYMGRQMSPDAPLKKRKRLSELLGEVSEMYTVSQTRSGTMNVDNRNEDYYKALKSSEEASTLMLKLFDPEKEGEGRRIDFDLDI
jgi:hypothetical protein